MKFSRNGDESNNFVELNGSRAINLNGELVESVSFHFLQESLTLTGEMASFIVVWFAPIDFIPEEIKLLQEIGETGKLSNLEGIELVINLRK